jgi:hypothetical protein
MPSPEVTMDLSAEDRNTINTAMRHQEYMDADEDVGSKKDMIHASLVYLLASLKKAEVRGVFVSPDNSWRTVWGLGDEVVHELYGVLQQAGDKSNPEVDWASFFYRREYLDSKSTFIYHDFSRILCPETIRYRHSR